MFFYAKTNENHLLDTLRNQEPQAQAILRGSEAFPMIYAAASFYGLQDGVVMSLFAGGLPHQAGRCQNRVFAVHIHEGSSCTGTSDGPFADAETHYNPNGCKHPHHAGDLPPLFESGGTGWYAFFTRQFTIMIQQMYFQGTKAQQFYFKDIFIFLI